MPEPDRFETDSPGADKPRRPPPNNAAQLNRTVLMCLIALFIGYFFSGSFSRWFGRSGGGVLSFETMNTYAHINVPAGSSTVGDLDSILAAAEKAVGEVNDLMGPFGERSEVRRLNEAAKGEWVEVSPQTWTVVMEALRWHRLSGGAFDPTIGPVKSLFSFDQREIAEWPSREAQAEARRRVGADKLLFEREGMRLAWAEDGMRLDLGAIAKGYAADRAAEILLQGGVVNALVEIGGELRVLGLKPGDPPAAWRTGIQNPRGSDIVERLEVRDAAVATSGDYERYFVHDGVRYEHIIDPRTAEPLSGGVASVTVVHPSSCLAADALATTMSVLGIEEGKRFLEENALSLFKAGVKVIMLDVLPDGGLRRVEYVVDTSGGVSVDAGEITAGTTRRNASGKD